MLEQCGFVSQRQRDRDEQKRTVCILKMNEWERENYILRTKKLECSQ